jgi:hypothetical protein
MRAQLQVHITPADVGKRVTIRSRIPAEPGEPRHSDTLGMLRSWRDGVLTVERRDGTCVELAEEDLAGARTLGPPPTRRRRA